MANRIVGLGGTRVPSPIVNSVLYRKMGVSEFRVFHFLFHKQKKYNEALISLFIFPFIRPPVIEDKWPQIEKEFMEREREFEKNLKVKVEKFEAEYDKMIEEASTKFDFFGGRTY